jgi:hypothetical protein
MNVAPPSERVCHRHQSLCSTRRQPEISFNKNLSAFSRRERGRGPDRGGRRLGSESAAAVRARRRRDWPGRASGRRRGPRATAAAGLRVRVVAGGRHPSPSSPSRVVPLHPILRSESRAESVTVVRLGVRAAAWARFRVQRSRSRFKVSPSPLTVT